MKQSKFVNQLLIAMSLGAVALLPTTTLAAKMSSEDKTQIEAVVHDYLKKNPEVILEAIQALQRKQFEQTAQTMKKTQENLVKYTSPLFHQANDPLAGNPNGKVTIVEFFDYQCAHCVDMGPVMETLIKSNPNVRVVYKEFPIRGPISEFAARAALAANKQGKYVQFNHALMTSTKQPLTEEIILELAKNNGLNVDQLKKDMKDSSIDAQLKANLKLGQDMHLFGTPAFVIGKTDASSSKDLNYIPGQMNLAQLEDVIKKFID